MTTEHDVKVAIQLILNDKKAHPTSLNYAVGYCQVARAMEGEELKVQCLYILNNIQHWRGENSKEVRATLKAFTR
jgi:uncharacterized protein YjaZ